MKNFLFLAAVFAFSSFATETTSSRVEIETLVDSYKKEKRRISLTLSELTKALHRERNRPQALSSLLGPTSDKRRNTKKLLLKSTIQSQLEFQKSIDQTLSELQEQLQLDDLRKSIELPKVAKKIKTKKKSSPFLCAKSPLSESNEMTLLRSFGTQTDKETKMSWEHPGWLLKLSETQLRSCSKAVVSFVGHIAGMGNVLILSGPKDSLVTYAHLGEIDKAISKIGAKVRPGQVLATTTQKLYIEARQNGTALSPDKILGPKLSIAR